MNNSIYEALYQQVVSANAKEGHFKLGGIFGNRHATGVISVYINETPAHEALVETNAILEELIEWAKTEKKKDVLDKLNELIDLEGLGYVTKEELESSSKVNKSTNGNGNKSDEVIHL